MTVDPHHRPNERAELAGLFDRGSSILMLAPRRIGKTWLMKRVAEDLQSQHWTCISIDLEGKSSEAEFLGELCKKIEITRSLKDKVFTQLRQRFSQITQNSEGGNLLDTIGRVNHREFLEVLVASLNADTSSTLILIDELALFIQEIASRDPTNAKNLLYHIRNLMQAYPNVRWFLTGSIGLDAVTRRHGISGSILGIEIYPITPFSEEEALSYIQDQLQRSPLKKTYTFDADAFRYLIKELGWLSPYYLALIVNLITLPSDRTTILESDIEAAIVKLLQPARRTHFAGWAEHIEKNFDEIEGRRMNAILNVLCPHSNGETKDTIIANLTPPNGQPPSMRQLNDSLIALQSDAYIKQEGNRWMFESGLVRRYWIAYHQQ